MLIQLVRICGAALHATFEVKRVFTPRTVSHDIALRLALCSLFFLGDKRDAYTYMRLYAVCTCVCIAPDAKGMFR